MKHQVWRGVPIRVFSEGEISAQDAKRPVPPKVQILRCGEFTDMKNGQFEISAKMLAAIKKNFDDKVRRVDISIDYAHDNGREAAGWITGLNLSEDGQELWADVKWTPTGTRKLSDLEFRYLSAEIANDYTDNETLKKYGPCLLGAGLTNRPVIKEMAPVIELQEGKGSEMKDMAEAEKKIKELSDELEAIQGAKKKLADEYAEFQKKAGAAAGKNKGKDGDGGEDEGKKELSEMKTKLADVQAKLILAEQKGTFTKLMAEGKAVPAQEEAFLKGDMVKFAELGAQALNLKAKGHGAAGEAGNPNESASSKVLALAEKKVDEKKGIDIGRAISLTLAENKELAEKYREESVNA